MQTEGDMAGIGGTGIADTRAAVGSPPAEPGSYPAAPPQSLGHKALSMFNTGLVSVKVSRQLQHAALSCGGSETVDLAAAGAW